MVNPVSAGDGARPGSLVYLDHAATTPMLPEALAAMTDELAHTGNPSSLHNAGRRARRVVEESREQIAQAFGARPSEVVFTSGGTEADNLAVKGLYWARRGRQGHGRPDRGRGRGSWPPRSSTTPCWTACRGSPSTRAPRSTGCGVDSAGLLSPDVAARRDRARSGQRRAGQRDVGEQRGRHGPAGRRARRGRPASTASRSTATRSRRPDSCRSASPAAAPPR